MSPVPRVSVLMTVYNGAAYLAQSLDSVVAQTFPDWELIVVQNGSSDDSPRILDRYTNPRIRRFDLQTNIGRTPALRYAFEQVRGQYIAVLDADDIALPERFARQVSYLDVHPEVVLLGAWADFIDERGDKTGEWRPPTGSEQLVSWLGCQNPIVHSAAMYRAAIAQEVGGYPADVPYSQDFGLWLKLAQRGDLAVLPECLCLFRIQSKSMSRAASFRIEVTRDLLRMMIKAGELLPLNGASLRSNREEVAIARMRYAAALYNNGRVGRAVLVAIRAFVTDPIHLLNNRVTRQLLAK